MDLILLEYADGTKNFFEAKYIFYLPDNAVAFTLFGHENGVRVNKEFRIGVAIKFALGDVCYELDANDIHNGDYQDKYALYGRSLIPINSDMTLVEDYEALENAFNVALGLDNPKR